MIITIMYKVNHRVLDNSINFVTTSGFTSLRTQMYTMKYTELVCGNQFRSTTPPICKQQDVKLN